MEESQETPGEGRDAPRRCPSWLLRSAALVAVSLVVVLCVFSGSTSDVRFDVDPIQTETFLKKTTDKVFVHLLGQQRTGSSFVGSVLDRADDVFFLYEPLVAIYSAMFGFYFGSRPNNIFFFSNGSRRTLSATELGGMELILKSTATCNFSSLPITVLLHPWWEVFASNMTSVYDYNRCLEAAGIHSNVMYTDCFQRHLAGACPDEFDPNDERTWICAEYLWYGRKVARPGEDTFKNRATGFSQCINQFTTPVKSCAVNHLDYVCASKPIRAIKTVRMTLSATLRVMGGISSDYRIINLIREPVGVINSRVVAPFAQSFYEDHNISKMAELYCKMAEEIHDSQTNIPIRTPAMEVSYAQVVSQPIKTFSDIFEFIGIKSIPNNSMAFLEAAQKKYSTQHHEPHPLKFIREVRCMCLSYLKKVLPDETPEHCS